MSEKLMVGGQAVIEGVMMRGPKKVATAVREPSGVITVDVKPINSLAEKYPIFKKPFFRGILSLGESLVMGLKSLTYSAYCNYYGYIFMCSYFIICSNSYSFC